MFLAVWLVYAGDRLLDGLGDGTDKLEARHLFHYRHQGGFCIAIAAASVALVPLALAIPAAMLRLYLVLAVLLAGWFAVVHGISRALSWKLPKEMMPAAFFVAAVFIPEWPIAGLRHGELALAAFTYGALVTLNCWFIFSWEHRSLHPADRATQPGVRWRRHLGAATVVLPLLAIPFRSEDLALVFVAISLAAALLMVLDRVSQRLHPTGLRAMSDLVLLTPLLIAPFLR